MSCEPWQWSHDDRDKSLRVIRRTTRRGDRHSRAADLDADGGQDSGGAQPQIVERPVLMRQVTVQDVVREVDRAIVYEDDREEDTLQSDAGTAKKVTINETSALLSVETTLT